MSFDPMSLDLVLAIAHHLAVFSLFGLLAAEIALLRPGLDASGLRRLSRIDAAYGACAGLVLVAGFLRVFFGAGSAEIYFANPVFWTKIGLFLLVGLLSLPPTITFLGWGRQLKTDPGFSPDAASVKRLRGFFTAELVLFAMIPMAAAAMARGIGL